MSDDKTTAITDVVVAMIEAKVLSAEAVPDMILRIKSAFEGSPVKVTPPAAAQKLTPAVAVKDSITKNYIVCLEDGHRLKMLKRYLRTQYDMTPEQYRQKWGLPSDYPMIAPAYSEVRADLARKSGLGRGQSVPVPKGRRATAKAR